MRTGNDVGRNQAITNTLTGIGTSSHSRVHSAGFSAHHDGDVAATHKFAADKADFSSLGHGIGRLNGGNHTAGLDHAEGNALNSTIGC